MKNVDKSDNCEMIYYQIPCLTKSVFQERKTAETIPDVKNKSVN